MQYFGGKAKIAKELSAFINTTYLQDNNKPFIDAFCGSCNIISKIDDKRIRIANDKHKELMAMWQWVQEHGIDRLPTDVSKELYYYIKTSTTYPDWLKGFDGLDAFVRARFQNDPAQFLEFVSDPKNAQEMTSLGIVTGKKSKPNPSPADPVSDD